MSLLHSCCSLLSWHGEQLKSDVIWLASSMQFAQLHIEYTTYARIPNTRFASPNENTLESNEADENPKSFLPIKHHWVFIQSISCMRFFVCLPLHLILFHFQYDANNLTSNWRMAGSYWLLIHIFMTIKNMLVRSFDGTNKDLPTQSVDIVALLC